MVYGKLKYTRYIVPSAFLAFSFSFYCSSFFYFYNVSDGHVFRKSEFDSASQENGTRRWNSTQQSCNLCNGMILEAAA